jgi:signal transduction histidine kinase
VDLAGDGLDVALRKQADLLDRVHDARVRFTGEPVPALPAARLEAAYRIAQEALHNALRHAHPDTVDIELSVAGGDLVLRISDDGVGFDPAATPANGSTTSARQLGLSSMRERANAVGGRLTVTSRPNGGTVVRLVVPSRD